MKLNAVIYGLPGSAVRVIYQDESGEQIGAAQTVQVMEKLVLPVDSSSIDIDERLLEDTP